MSAARQCDACGSPLAADQRYCLACGTRAGARGAQLETLLARVRANGADVDAAAAGADAAGATAAEGGDADAAAAMAAGGLASAPARWEPRLPGPLVSIVLVLLFVGFGALLGDTGAGAGTGQLSAAAPSVKLLVPHSSAATRGAGTGARASTSTGAGAGREAEPPSAEPEATPAPSESSEAPAASPETTGAGSGARERSAPASEGATKPAAKTPARKLTSIKHVFVIVLDDEPYAADFGPESKASYLARTLESKGELLLRYDAVAHEQLPNGVALISGQGPTAQSAANCQAYTPLLPGTLGGEEQALGDGCVYPASVQTLPGQLTAKHLTWKAYVQGQDEGAGTPPACSHPEAGAVDTTYATGAYATYRNPFVYFQSIASSPACAVDDVGLAQLQQDLSSASSTPSFSYIVPDRCDDGGPTPCSPAAPTGAADSAPLLSRIVPQIMASKAYEKGGLIVITSDEAPSSGEYADSSSCCGQPAYPNLTTAGLRHGGGVVGALLLSPFVKGGTTAQEPYNHYALLRTIEDVFGLGHIGYAALPSVKSFSASLLNAPVKR